MAADCTVGESEFDLLVVVTAGEADVLLFDPVLLDVEAAVVRDDIDGVAISVLIVVFPSIGVMVLEAREVRARGSTGGLY